MARVTSSKERLLASIVDSKPQPQKPLDTDSDKPCLAVNVDPGKSCLFAKALDLTKDEPAELELATSALLCLSHLSLRRAYSCEIVNAFGMVHGVGTKARQHRGRPPITYSATGCEAGCPGAGIGSDWQKCKAHDHPIGKTASCVLQA